MSSLPIIVAHRGLHTIAPENSLDAFTAAVEGKIPWVECDVWPASDGTPVVIHDESLDRTTSGRGPVAQYSSKELQQFHVPTLDQLIAVLGENTGLLIEIKPKNALDFVGKVLNQLRGFPGPWMIQSFEKENVIHAQDPGSKIPTAFLAEEPQGLKDALEMPWPSIHLEHPMIHREMVERLHSMGRKIGAWTVNEPGDIRRMVDFGIDMLITDEPQLAAQIIATR